MPVGARAIALGAVLASTTAFAYPPPDTVQRVENPSQPGLPWESLMPGNIRTPLSTTGLRNPFSPVVSASAPSGAGPASEFPDPIAQRLRRLSAELRACIAAPSQLVLIGSRIYRPGDEISEPRETDARGRPESPERLRIVLQSVESDGARLLVEARAHDGRSRQHEMILKVVAGADHGGSQP